MSLQLAVRVCLRKYVDWSGRATRAEYWYFVLFYCLVLIAGGIVSGALHNAIPVILVVLGLWLPSWSANIRRLHDTGRSGAWNWITVIPIAGGIVLFIFLIAPGDVGPNRFGPPVSPTLGGSLHPGSGEGASESIRQAVTGEPARAACQRCGEHVAVSAVACRFCGQKYPVATPGEFSVRSVRHVHEKASGKAIVAALLALASVLSPVIIPHQEVRILLRPGHLSRAFGSPLLWTQAGLAFGGVLMAFLARGNVARLPKVLLVTSAVWVAACAARIQFGRHFRPQTGDDVQEVGAIWFRVIELHGFASLALFVAAVLVMTMRKTGVASPGSGVAQERLAEGST
jgi:uncharacterized membrane protein YhaH (DUF805 family)